VLVDERLGPNGRWCTPRAGRMLYLEVRLAALSCSANWRQAAGLPMSPRINHVGGCFDDLPEGTVGTVVVNAPRVVRAQFL